MPSRESVETSRNIVMKKFEAGNFRSLFFDEFLFLLIRMSPSLYLEGMHLLMFLQRLEVGYVHFFFLIPHLIAFYQEKLVQ